MIEQIINSLNWFKDQLISNTDIKVTVALCGVLIAIATFVINFILKPIYINIKKKHTKIKIKAVIDYKMTSTILGVYHVPPVITVSVVNESDKSVFIENIIIKIIQPKKTHNIDTFYIMNPQKMFPKKLEPFEKFQREYDTFSLYEPILSQLNLSDKITFIVKTGTNKTYTSNPIANNDIITHLKIVSQLQQNTNI